MPDKQNPNDPTYDWLYAQSGSPADGEPTRAIARPTDPDRPDAGDQPADDTSADLDSADAPAESDHEATSVIDRPASPADPAAASGAPTDEPEHTQVLGVPPAAVAGAAGASAAAAATAQPGAAPTAVGQGAPPPAQPPSFGGTYPAPGPSRASGSTYPPAQQPGMRYAPPSSPPARPPAGPPSAPSGAGRPPAKKSSKRKWWIRGIIIAIAAWLVFLVVVPIIAWSRISKVDAEPEGDRPADTPGTTYLLVGSDSRAGLSDEERGELGTGNAGGERTDTIILLHVPDGDGPKLLLSIPRDSYVDIPGHGKNKINAAYSLGGPKLLVQTVEQATDLRVDNYVEIGFGGFVNIVDAVGGVTVCPKEAIDDPKAGHLKMKKGCQKIDGATALGYARSRHFANGDITRGEHQRELIAAVGKEALSWQTIVFPWRYWQLNMAAADSLRIGENVGPLDMMRFGWAITHTSGGDAKRCVVPIATLGTSTPVGSVVTWNEDAANALFDAIREDRTSSIKCSALGQ